MYINSPLNFTGSKFKILDQLIPKFDVKKKIFIDLFTGGGCVFANVLDKYKYVFVNDIITDLIEIHKEILLNTDEFVSQVKNYCVEKTDKSGFHKLRDEYNLDPDPARLMALILCSTNNFMRFNKKFRFNNTFGKRTFNPNSQKKIDAFAQCCKPHLKTISLKCGSFDKVPVDGDAFYYIDPPFTGTEAGYNAYWNKDDDFKLYEYISSIMRCGASFALSGIEREGVHNPLMKMIQALVGSGVYRYELENDYKKVARVKRKPDLELLYTNYEI